jgi:HAD superfamily hydrolase (TIGR01509 family)
MAVFREPVRAKAYRAGVPDQAEPPSPRQPAGHALQGQLSNGFLPHRPVDAVFFDFHGTLAQVEDAVTWVRASADACGHPMETGPATVMADRLVSAGRAGGPLPRRVPPHLIEVWAERDLYAHAHRAAFTGLAETVAADVDGLPEALYERVISPAGWLAYADAAPTLAALRSAGVRTAVISNIGFDIRPLLAEMGMADLFDACVLSFEIGRCKPDPAIFRAACAALDIDPEVALMVGDSAADAAATAIGCAAYIVPAAGPGASNGLAAVMALAGATRDQ